MVDAAAFSENALLVEYGLAAGLTVIVFFAHIALRPLSGWIERVAPPLDKGPR